MGRNIKNHTNGRKIKRNNPPFIRMINKRIQIYKPQKIKTGYIYFTFA